jgi:hypothetical protein
MIASTGKPGTGEGTNVLVVVVLAVVLLELELIVDELVELPVLVEAELDVVVLPVDVVVDELVEDVVVELVVLVVSMSIEVPQCTSVPCHPAAQPSSDAMKLAL